MADALTELAEFIRLGRTDANGKARELLANLFGGRYHKSCAKDALIRDALGMAGSQDEDRAEGTSGSGRPENVPFAGLTAPDNPPAGPYGGASVVWFPVPGEGSLLTFVVGTRGLNPDEGLLTRPGHRRRVAALRRRLAALGVPCWTKSDPSALSVPIPEVTRRQFAPFDRALKRYGQQLYCIARVPKDDSQKDLARTVVRAFFDLYAHERNWTTYKEAQADSLALMDELRADLFPPVTQDQVYGLLLQRRFVVLQGPPGTGKTRLAGLILKGNFGGRGTRLRMSSG
jgi:5-methylcytosine-specific restriction protein B